MPELPEVETVRRSLEPLLVSRTITKVWRSALALRREKPDPGLLKKALQGARVLTVDRAGKYILVRTSQGGALVHLGMSGQLTVEKPGSALRPHTHVRLTLGDGNELRYVDPRRFGLFRPYLREGVPQEWSALGLDPLAESFSTEKLREQLARTKRAVKLALLDQALIAGLGNIYVSEALFLARVHPSTEGHRISSAQAARLRDAIVTVLRQGIANRGTSLNDYVDATGAMGNNQSFLNVYGREGEPCVTCGARVKMSVMGARSTYFCVKCQPRRRG